MKKLLLLATVLLSINVASAQSTDMIGNSRKSVFNKLDKDSKTQVLENSTTKLLAITTNGIKEVHTTVLFEDKNYHPCKGTGRIQVYRRNCERDASITKTKQIAKEVELKFIEYGDLDDYNHMVGKVKFQMVDSSNWGVNHSSYFNDVKRGTRLKINFNTITKTLTITKSKEQY